MMALVFAGLIWAVGWWINTRLARSRAADTRAVNLLIPAIFGLTLVLMWQVLVVMLDVSPIILPAPSDIAVRFASSTSILWADFQQTILKGALTGYIIGMVAAFFVALLADRSIFLTRGILPVGAFMAALPIVGTAPIFVKWLAWIIHEITQSFRAPDLCQFGCSESYSGWAPPSSIQSVLHSFPESATEQGFGERIARFMNSPG